MKFNNIAKILLISGAMMGLASCHNAEKIFPDYDGGITTYFAYQYPVRTIVLGESETFDTSLDNEGKCIIYGTMGGAYEGKDVVIDIEVDNTLTNNLFFDAEGTKPVKAMPENYYKLSGNQLVYSGNHMGGVEVSLTEDFFKDPDAINTTYVVPVKMTNIVKGADQILAGTPAVEGEPAWRTDASQWKTLPKDYTLYAIKYINQWDGSWLRRGEDTITDVETGEVTTDIRKKQYVENDEVIFLTTESLNSVRFPMTVNVVEIVPPPTQYSLSASNSVAGNNYAQQAVYTFGTPLKTGSTYVLTCMTKSTVEEYSAGIFLADADGNQTYSYPAIPFTNEWKKQTLEFTVSGNDAATIMINTGDLVGTIWIDDISIVEKGKTDEYITDGNFPNATRPAAWNAWGSGTPAQVVPEGYSAVELLPTEQIVPVATDLILTFNGDDITVSSATEGVTASGTGEYVKDGEKLAWGNKDRDGIYLEYNVDFGTKKYAIKDVLVSRSREVIMETFAPTFKK